jgi:RHS repeat-associated protein
VYDLSGRLIAEADDTGQTLREYIWLDDMPLAVVADVDTVSPKLWFVHADHLDRPIKMTDGSQAVVWDAVYRPFGGAVSITGSASNNLRFPGQYFLIESGLHYNWHRHYDPTTGRYLQADPLEFINGPSLYAYARSSPIIAIDELGLAVGDFPPAPPGYDPRTWRYEILKNGRHSLIDPEGKRWICHPEDRGHWRHWDKPDDDDHWPRNNRKWRANQIRDYRSDQSRVDPSGDMPQWVPPIINELTPYAPWPRGIPAPFSRIPGISPRSVPRFVFP